MEPRYTGSISMPEFIPPPKIAVTNKARYESHQVPLPATENALCISLVYFANPL